MKNRFISRHFGRSRVFLSLGLALVVVTSLGAFASLRNASPSNSRHASAQSNPTSPAPSLFLPLVSKFFSINPSNTAVRATVSFKHPLTATEFVQFVSDISFQLEYLYFVEYYEGEGIMGGHRVPDGTNVSEALESLRKARVLATESYIKTLEGELQPGLQDRRKAIIDHELVRLRSRLASPEIVPGVYAINIETTLAQLDRAKSHLLVHTTQILSPESQGEPVFPSQ